MSLRVVLRLKTFLFEKETMWRVRINADGPDWMVKRLTQQEAVAQAAGMQWGGNDYKITKTGPDVFAIACRHRGNQFRPMGIATCIRA